MTTSGTTSFNLDIADCIEEAYERCGKELRSGYDMRTARRSLNLMQIEWANRGLNLWTVDQQQIVFATGQALYPLPLDTVDVLDAVVRENNGTTNQIDISISRISEPTYAVIPNKLTQGRPIQFWFNRQSGQENPTGIALAVSILSTDTTIQLSSTVGLAATGFIKINNETIGYANISGNSLVNCYRGQNNTSAAGHSNGATITVQNLPCVNIWPTPSAPGNQYSMIYYRMRRIQDATGSVTVSDIPFRFIPCLVAGLASSLSMKLPGVDPERIAALKMDYEQQFDLAASEDRDTAPLRFVPRNMMIG